MFSRGSVHSATATTGVFILLLHQLGRFDVVFGQGEQGIGIPAREVPVGMAPPHGAGPGVLAPFLIR
jgi:hypothetical protein